MTAATMNKMLAVVMGLASVPMAACGGGSSIATPTTTSNTSTASADTPADGCLALVEHAAGGKVDVQNAFDPATIDDADARTCCMDLNAEIFAGMSVEGESTGPSTAEFSAQGCCEVTNVGRGAFCTPWGPAMPPAMPHTGHLA